MITKTDLKEWSFLYDSLERLNTKIQFLKINCVNSSVLDYKKKCIESDMLDLIREIERIEAAVDALPPLERDLIFLRYREGKSWFYISLELGYSEDHVRGKLHKKALAFLRDFESSKEHKRTQNP